MHRFLAFVLFASATFAQENVSTFSIVAYDAEFGLWGVAVASRYFSVGSVVPWAEAGVGAVATQANVNVGYGPKGLALLRQGLSASEVLKRLLDEDTFPGKDGRQVAIIDGKGTIAAYTGPNAPNWAGDRQGKNWSAQGNILVGAQVPEAMGRAFEATQGGFAEKMWAALKAGDDAGGDSRGRQSASMLIVRKGGGRNINNDRVVYINVDDAPNPFPELRRLLDINLGLLSQERLGRLLDSGDMGAAVWEATAVARDMPQNPQGPLTLGFFAYFDNKESHHKVEALRYFRKARELDPAGFQRRFDQMARRPVFKKILEDQDFLKQLFPEN